jgi:penicillin G amidase
MRFLKKFLIIAVILLALILTGGLFMARNMSRNALPDYRRDVILKGLQEEVTVLRKEHAIPVIMAGSEQDLYRAVGYVMAQDRLWQMDLLRRATTGRLSEIFGEDLAETDLLLRSLRIPEKSELILSRSDKKVIDALAAFADGVNQFIEMNGDRLPPEFRILRYRPEKWEPVHSVNLTGYMAWDLNMGWSSEVILYKLSQKLDGERFTELIPDLDLQTTKIYAGSHAATEILNALVKPSEKLRELGLEVFSGSNSWAVSGSKSTTGAPIFANDMHLAFMAPGIWYRMHHVIEGKLNVTGVVLPGQPFVVAGHNERIAWGMTNVMLDDIDFYLETLNPANPRQYRFMGEWRDMKVVSENIKTGKNSTVGRELFFTHRGPVISRFKNLEEEETAISMRWLGNEFSNELLGVYLLNRAGNWDDFRKATANFISVSQNINYIDVDGNIGLQTAAGIPLREGKGMLVVPGEDDTYDWRGLVPFEELPYTYNPPSGFVVSANNRTIDDEYPYHISHWFDIPARYDRIREMLMNKDNLSVEDFKAIQVDKKSRLAERMVPGLIHELRAMPAPSGNERMAAEMLREWDMVYRAESPEPLIFEKFYNRFLENLLLEEMGEELYPEFIGDKILVRSFIDRVWTKRESAWLAGDRTFTGPGSFRDIVQKSFHEAIEWLGQNHGSSPARWAWGDVHTLTINHPMSSVRLLDRVFRFNREKWSPGGSFHTVNPYAYNYTDPFRVNHGASQRHIFSAADWDESWSVIPTGISGLPASDYYLDQSGISVRGEYLPDVFSPGAVQSSARYRMKLLPPGAGE